MTVDPFQRFLGVEGSADPKELLQLPHWPCDRVQVETALRDRLDKVYRHPDGRSEEAERVRRRLREVAVELVRLSVTQQHRAQTGAARGGTVDRAPPLTEFDSSVLAILIGYGGWNARSRAHLVALAGAHNITPGGLIKVIGGLNRYARTGGPRLDLAQLTAGFGRVGDPPRAGDAEPVSLASVTAAIQAAEGPPPDAVWTTIKLSFVFGLLTLVLGIIVLRSVLDTDSTSSPQPDEVHVAGGPDLSSRVASRDARDGGRAPLRTQPASYRRLPTFLGNARPPEATNAADEAPGLSERLDQVARMLAVSDEPSEQAYRNWSVSIDTIASGWVLVDQSTRQAVDRAIDDVLFETVNAPSVSDRLLESFTPPTGRLGSPLEIWRGAWRAGTLGAISGSVNLPRVVVERARSQLSVALGDQPANELLDFDAAASAWLDQAAAGLADVLEFDDQVYDFWEMWLHAERELGRNERYEVAIMRAVGTILYTDTDLSNPGPSANVLGRLLTLADFNKSEDVRSAVLGFFEDDSVSTSDLWVLTSLLASLDTAPWFTADLVMPDEGGSAFRNRMRDRIAAAWPEIRAAGDGEIARGRGIRVDPRVGGRWMSVRLRVMQQPAPADDEALMRQLVLVCRINEAASLLAAQKVVEAEALLDEIDEAMSAVKQSDAGGAGPGVAPPAPSIPFRIPGGGPQPTVGRRGVRPGQVLSRDGDWAAIYAEARRNTEEKMNALRQLRSSAGTDLGPIDAETFVQEVYRGSPQEVRSFARSILAQLFASGPIVAMEMLDQFPDAPRNEGMSETIRSLAGAVLPDARSEAWQAAARVALIEHVIMLRRRGPSSIDDAAAELVMSYGHRLSLIRGPSPLSTSLGTPHLVVRQLAEAWQDRALGVMSSNPVPDDLPGLQRRFATRRRLAHGPVQMMVADLLGVLDDLAYITVAEQPRVRNRVLEILSDSAQRRRDAEHVLQQAIQVENGIASLWAIRTALTAENGGNPEVGE